MNQVTPRRYRLRLEPDLENFVFSGWTEIEIETAGPVSEITLNAVELEIRSCEIILEGGERRAAVFSSPDPVRQTFLITLPRPVSGPLRLAVEYSGILNDSLLGWYRSRWRDGDGREGYIAVTQFEEDYARKAFPCFDRPDLKAVFDIEMLIPAGTRGISNMPAASEESLPDGRRRVQFASTPPMSTYLVFFGVGEFECLEDPGEPLLRAFTTPGKIELSRDGLRFSRRCLDFFSEYFGTPYPLPKLDLIAVPDFAFGAMENWGAMTFRENLMLVYPGITSRKALQRLYEVIAHEIVHQWFGDLVTPAEWKYLWLNESFATLFGNLAVDRVFPEWDTMESYLLETTGSAFDRDALEFSFPVELGEEARITAATAPIIYDKGGSVMQMVIAWLGDGVSKGLADYFGRHAYGQAKSSDMWEALERSYSGAPVAAMMKSWVERLGYPLLRARRAGRSLHVSQERFAFLERGRGPGFWIIPLSMLKYEEGGQPREAKLMMEGPEFEIPLGEKTTAVKLNSGQTGFYRVAYEGEERLRLAQLAASRVLPARDRFGLQDDAYALVRSGEYGVREYLALAEEVFRNEDDPLPLHGILRNLAHLHLISQGGERTEIRSAGLSQAQRILALTGLEPRDRERLPVSSLRNAALWRAVVYGGQPQIRFCLERFREAVGAGSFPHPDIADAVWRAGASLEPGAFAHLSRRFLKSESEQERMVLSSALGCIHPDSLTEVLDFCFEKIPPALRYVPLMISAGHPVLAPKLMDLFLKDRPRWETLHAAHFERVMVEVAAVGGLGREEETRAFFKDYAPESLGAYAVAFRESMRMALEILEVNSRLRGNGSLPPTAG